MIATALAALLSVGSADGAVRSAGYGQPGPAGQQGAKGDAGPAGAQGGKGDQGPQGVPGQQGAPGATGPAGPSGQAGAKGDQGPAGSQGAAGLKGDAGATGPAGPKASTFVCNATIADGPLLLALSSGIKILPNVACSGVLTTDILEVYPTAPATFPAGYAVHHALPTAAGKFSAVISVPQLGLGASYSIPVAVYAVNR